MKPWLAASCVVGMFGWACSEHMQLAARGGGGRWLPDHFWPPPDATAVWASGPHVEGDADSTFGGLADEVRAALDAAGYEHGPWLAVGAGYTHGFAVLTRLAREGAAKGERFTPAFPAAPTLEWLESSRPFEVPSGRYRVLLVAVTDLPFVPVPHRAPVWDASTWLGEARGPLPLGRRVSARYRVGVYVYEYRAGDDEDDAGKARFVSRAADGACATLRETRASLVALPWGASSGSVASPACIDVTRR